MELFDESDVVATRIIPLYTRTQYARAGVLWRRETRWGLTYEAYVSQLSTAVSASIERDGGVLVCPVSVRAVEKWAEGEGLDVTNPSVRKGYLREINGESMLRLREIAHLPLVIETCELLDMRWEIAVALSEQCGDEGRGAPGFASEGDDLGEDSMVILLNFLEDTIECDGEIEYVIAGANGARISRALTITRSDDDAPIELDSVFHFELLSAALCVGAMGGEYTTTLLLRVHTGDTQYGAAYTVYGCVVDSDGITGMSEGDIFSYEWTGEDGEMRPPAAGHSYAGVDMGEYTLEAFYDTGGDFY
jgi:hypothetical protein